MAHKSLQMKRQHVNKSLFKLITDTKWREVHQLCSFKNGFEREGNFHKITMQQRRASIST